MSAVGETYWPQSDLTEMDLQQRVNQEQPMILEQPFPVDLDNTRFDDVQEEELLSGKQQSLLAVELHATNLHTTDLQSAEAHSTGAHDNTFSHLLATDGTGPNTFLEQYEQQGPLYVDGAFSEPPRSWQESALIAHNANRENAKAFRQAPLASGGTAMVGTHARYGFDPSRPVDDEEEDDDDGLYERMHEDEIGGGDEDGHKKRRVRGNAPVERLTVEILNNASEQLATGQQQRRLRTATAEEETDVRSRVPQRIRTTSSSNNKSFSGKSAAAAAKQQQREPTADGNVPTTETPPDAIDNNDFSVVERRGALATLCAVIQRHLIDDGFVSDDGRNIDSSCINNIDDSFAVALNSDDWAHLAEQFAILGLRNIGDALARGEFGVPVGISGTRARLHAALKILCGTQHRKFVCHIPPATSDDATTQDATISTRVFASEAPLVDTNTQKREAILLASLAAIAPPIDDASESLFSSDHNDPEYCASDHNDPEYCADVRRYYAEKARRNGTAPPKEEEKLPTDGGGDAVPVSTTKKTNQPFLLTDLTLEEMEEHATWRVFRMLDAWFGKQSRGVTSLINADCTCPHTWAKLVRKAKPKEYLFPANVNPKTATPTDLLSVAVIPFLAAEYRRQFAWICSNGLLSLLEFAMSGHVFSAASFEHALELCFAKLREFEPRNLEANLYGTRDRLLQSMFWASRSLDDFSGYLDVSVQLKKMFTVLPAATTATVADGSDAAAASSTAASAASATGAVGQTDAAMISFHTQLSAGALSHEQSLADMAQRLREIFDRRMHDLLRAKCREDFNDTMRAKEEEQQASEKANTATNKATAANKKRSRAATAAAAMTPNALISSATLDCLFPKTMRWIVQQTTMTPAQSLMLQNDIVGVRRLLDEHLDSRTGTPKASFWSVFGVDDRSRKYRTPLPILICWQRGMPSTSSSSQADARSAAELTTAEKTAMTLNHDKQYIIRHYAIFVYAHKKDSPTREAIIRCVDPPYTGEYLRSATGFSKLLTSVYRFGNHSAPAGYDAVFYPSASKRTFEPLKGLLNAGTVDQGVRGVCNRLTSREIAQMGPMLNMEDGTLPRAVPKQEILDQWYLKVPVYDQQAQISTGVHYVHGECAKLLILRAMPTVVSATIEAVREHIAQLVALEPDEMRDSTAIQEDDQSVSLASVFDAVSKASVAAEHTKLMDDLALRAYNIISQDSQHRLRLQTSSHLFSEVVGPGTIGHLSDIEAVHKMPSSKKKTSAAADDSVAEVSDQATAQSSSISKTRARRAFRSIKSASRSPAVRTNIASFVTVDTNFDEKNQQKKKQNGGDNGGDEPSTQPKSSVE